MILSFKSNFNNVVCSLPIHNEKETNIVFTLPGISVCFISKSFEKKPTISRYYLRLQSSSAADCNDVTNVPLLHLALVPMEALSINHDQNWKMLQSHSSGFEVRYLKIRIIQPIYNRVDISPNDRIIVVYQRLQEFIC